MFALFILELQRRKWRILRYIVFMAAALGWAVPKLVSMTNDAAVIGGLLLAFWSAIWGVVEGWSLYRLFKHCFLSEAEKEE